MYIWVTVLLAVAFDRISKTIVVNLLELGESVPVIPGFFHITYILNPGAAFGMLAGRNWLFILTAILVIGAIVYFQGKVPEEHRLMRICLALIAGGAFGNLYDRIFIGKVIDFLDFKVWSYIFNIADSMIVIGGFLLVFLIYKSERSAED